MQKLSRLFVSRLTVRQHRLSRVPAKHLQAFKVSPPVGAVVHASVEAKGSPLEHDWYRFYTNKLDPLTPNHEKYFPWFVANFMDPGKADWQEFRQQVEADPGSPWQVVLVKVRDAEGRGPVAIQAQAGPDGIQFQASAYFAD